MGQYNSLGEYAGPHTASSVFQQMVQMAFCDLSHTFHKQATNVSQHVMSFYCGEF